MPPLNRIQKSGIALAIGHAVSQHATAGTIEVDTHLDAIDPSTVAGCTLRKAINTFDSGVAIAGCTVLGSDTTGPDTIILSPTLASSTITLAGQALTISNDTQESNITIQGNGVTIDGDAQSSIFFLNNNNRLSLDNLTLTNGNNYAGGAIHIRGGGDVSLSNCLLTRNTSNDGGAIYSNRGILDVSDCVISENTASSFTADGGGGYIRNSVSNFRRVTFDSNVVTRENYSDGAPTGGGVFVSGGEASFEDSTFTFNRAEDSRFGSEGGAIGASNGAAITLSRTTLANNFAAGNGGGIFGRSDVSSIELVNCTVSGNSAGGSGGGIFQSGSLTLLNSTLSGNEAGNNGGGFFVSLASVSIANSLIAGNKASSRGSELYMVSAGLTNSGVNLFGSSGADSTVGLNPAIKDIVVDTSTSAQLGAVLSTLADNGGATLTHALPASSPAISAADSALCAASLIDNIDQRGEPRDNNCDIGAFEFIREDDSSFFVIPTANGKNVIVEL